MKCYNHHTTDAIAICKSCGKGLCQDCAAELPNGIACKNKCEDRVNLLNSMVDNNAKIIAASNRNIKATGYFSIIFGGLFAILGTTFFLSNNIFGMIFVTIGLVFMLYGILRLVKKSQFPSTNLEQKEDHNKN